MTKGTVVNKAIRHYFGLGLFSEYAKEVTKEGEQMDMHNDEEVPVCDYMTMTPKQFFQEYVSKYRPCLFKGYAKTWPAYGKW